MTSFRYVSYVACVALDGNPALDGNKDCWGDAKPEKPQPEAENPKIEAGDRQWRI